MLRSSTVSGNCNAAASSEPNSHEGNSKAGADASRSHARHDIAIDGDYQYAMGFQMSPRMFQEGFRLKPWQPGAFARVQEDGEPGVAFTADDLRAYHHRQYMVDHHGRVDLPLRLQMHAPDAIQLDCQHRPVLVKHAMVRLPAAALQHTFTIVNTCLL